MAATIEIIYVGLGIKAPVGIFDVDTIWCPGNKWWISKHGNDNTAGDGSNTSPISKPAI